MVPAAALNGAERGGARRRRVAGAPAAGYLGAAATPLARRPLAMSHRTGAPLERGGGGGTEVLAVCYPTLALGRSSKHALHRTSRAARSARRLRHPHPTPGDNVRSYAGGTCRRPGAQRPRVRRRARSAWPRSGCRRHPGAQRPRHRHQARNARRRWQPQCAAALSGCPTAPHPHPCTLGGSCLLAQL